MIDTNLIYLSLAEAAKLIEKGEVSPLDLTDACIARAEALDATLHAYLTMTFETARQEARTAGEEIAAGKYRGPLHGVPFAIKDLYDTAGVLTTYGSRVTEHNVPAEDARTVELLKQAQYRPIPWEKQTLLILAGTSGLLDSLPVDSLGKFETELFAFLDASHASLLEKLRETKSFKGELGDEAKAALNDSVETYRATLGS